MKSKLEIFLKLFIVVDLIILLLNFLNNYVDVDWVSASPGRRLNNPLAGLLEALFLLGWVNPKIKKTSFEFLRTLITEIPRGYYFFGLLILMQIFLEGMHLTSPAKSYWDLNIEKGYATFFSTIQLYILGLAVLTIANERMNDLNPIPKFYEWNLVAFLFMYLSLDECIGIHDKVNVEAINFLPHWEGMDSVFLWLWVYAPMILATVIFLVRFFIRASKNNPKVRLAFLAGLSSWVAALVLEGIARSSSFPRYLLIAMEEGAEMVGTTLLLLGFAIYLKNIPSDK
ncbi:MAG: hypothetical protein IID17_11870 [Nitrospinae bacterium]|nr:hypothetical protein [Nitrospinota bacterium]